MNEERARNESEGFEIIIQRYVNFRKIVKKLQEDSHMTQEKLKLTDKDERIRNLEYELRQYKKDKV